MYLSDFPNVAKQLFIEKNGYIDPNTISYGSHKKLWWQCNVSSDHIWETEVRCRTKRNYGCPYCKGKLPSSNYNLAAKHPNLLAEWDYKKNTIKPTEVLPSSTKKVFWICTRGHSYMLSVNQKSSKNIKCPTCSGYKIDKDNNLEYLFPKIATEWDYELNKAVKPNQVTAYTHKKYWFKCEHHSSYFARISDRTSSNSGCPKCAKSKNISSHENIIFNYLKKYMPKGKQSFVFKGIRKAGLELDIFYPSLNLAIEYDGYYWHKDKIEKDKLKNLFCKSLQIKLIRIREKPLPKISEDDIILDSKRKIKDNDLLKIRNKINNVYSNG